MATLTRPNTEVPSWKLSEDELKQRIADMTTWNHQERIRLLEQFESGEALDMALVQANARKRANDHLGELAVAVAAALRYRPTEVIQTGFVGQVAAWVPETRRATTKGEVVPRIVLMSGVLWISGYDWAVRVWHDLAPDALRIYQSGNTQAAEGVILPLLEGDTLWNRMWTAWEDDQAVVRRMPGSRKLEGSAPKKAGKSHLHPRQESPDSSTKTTSRPSFGSKSGSKGSRARSR